MTQWPYVTDTDAWYLKETPKSFLWMDSGEITKAFLEGGFGKVQQIVQDRLAGCTSVTPTTSSQE